MSSKNDSEKIAKASTWNNTLFCLNSFDKIIEESNESGVSERKYQLINSKIADCEDGLYIIPGFEFLSNKSVVPAYATVRKLEGKIHLNLIEILTNSGLVPINNKERLSQLGFLVDNFEESWFYSYVLGESNGLIYPKSYRLSSIKERMPLNKIQSQEWFSYKYLDLSKKPEGIDLSYKSCFHSGLGDSKPDVNIQTIPLETPSDPNLESKIQFALIVFNTGFLSLGSVEIVNDEFIGDVFFLLNSFSISIHKDCFSSTGSESKTVSNIFPMKIRLINSIDTNDKSILFKLSDPITLNNNDLNSYNKSFIQDLLN